MFRPKVVNRKPLIVWDKLVIKSRQDQFMAGKLQNRLKRNEKKRWDTSMEHHAIRPTWRYLGYPLSRISKIWVKITLVLSSLAIESIVMSYLRKAWVRSELWTLKDVRGQQNTITKGVNLLNYTHNLVNSRSSLLSSGWVLRRKVVNLIIRSSSKRRIRKIEMKISWRYQWRIYFE